MMQEFCHDNYFGEMALIDDYVRAASVVADDRTEVLSLAGGTSGKRSREILLSQ
ncbi:MAG: hypothetical protein J7M32_03655 [Deltaproteobacteria bacterium]|nr:hypothetical protein [Deltaproteobacteria bacterium]